MSSLLKSENGSFDGGRAGHFPPIRGALARGSRGVEGHPHVSGGGVRGVSIICFNMF